MQINIDTNLLDYSDWTGMTTGSTNFFTALSDANNSNYRTPVTDPFGNTQNAWVAYSLLSSSTTASGIDKSTYINIDNTKKYRFSVWISKETTGLCNIYGGLRCYTSADNFVYFKRLSTDANNDYVISSNTSVLSTTNKWYLYVAHILPYTWTGTTNDVDSGIYSGTTLVTTTGIYDAKWINTIAKAKYRILAPYATVSGDTYKLDFIYPRIDLVDGTEPSIATLLAGEGPWRNVVKTKINIDSNLLNYSVWATGQTGSIGQFNQITSNGTVNSRVLDTDPFNNSNIVWQSYNANSGASSGGYTSTAITIDPSKTYRNSVWVKRLNAGFGEVFNRVICNVALTDVSATGTTNTTFNLTYGADANTIPLNQWMLHMSYIRPYTWTGTTDDPNTGIITTGGTNKGISYGVGDVKFASNATQIQPVIYAPYAYAGMSVTGITYEIAYPRFELVDGTEPSLTTLLAGEGPWRTVNAGWVNIGDVWKAITGTTW